MKNLSEHELRRVTGGGIWSFIVEYIGGKILDYALPELQSGYTEMYASGYSPFGTFGGTKK
ncbi:MAG: hypothetical protein ACOZDD_01865 [Bacteroidota bacterium]